MYYRRHMEQFYIGEEKESLEMLVLKMSHINLAFILLIVFFFVSVLVLFAEIVYSVCIKNYIQ